MQPALKTIFNGQTKARMINLKRLHLASVIESHELQSRETIQQSVVEEYADAMREGAEFPPCKVVFDGVSYFLIEGFHRIYAMRKVGYLDAEFEVVNGTKSDGILLSAASNATHGLRRTNADKRRSAMFVLTHPEGKDWSDRRIAEHVSISHVSVATYRAELQPEIQVEKFTTSTEKPAIEKENAPAPEPKRRTGADGKSYPVPERRKIEHLQGQPAEQKAVTNGTVLPDVLRDVNGTEIPLALVPTFTDYVSDVLAVIDNASGLLSGLAAIEKKLKADKHSLVNTGGVIHLYKEQVGAILDYLQNDCLPDHIDVPTGKWVGTRAIALKHKATKK